MHLQGNVSKIIEWSYLPYMTDDTLVAGKQDFPDLQKVAYWVFNDSGYIMETGYMLPDEDSLFRIFHYSQNWPYLLEYTINEMQKEKAKMGNDTVNYTVIRENKKDTLFQKTYFLSR